MILTWNLRLRLAISLSSLLLAMPACFNIQNHPAVESVQSTRELGGLQPVVEAYIEYPGPQPKWGGPASFIVHVLARDSRKTQVTITPSLLNMPEARKLDGNVTVNSRQPASTDGLAAEAVHQGVRDKLHQLAEAIQEKTPEFRGCLYPVRLKLIRADGSLVEALGCRSQSGWPLAVSAAASYFSKYAEAQSK